MGGQGRSSRAQEWTRLAGCVPSVAAWAFHSTGQKSKGPHLSRPTNSSSSSSDSREKVTNAARSAPSCSCPPSLLPRSARSTRRASRAGPICRRLGCMPMPGSLGSTVKGLLFAARRRLGCHRWPRARRRCRAQEVGQPARGGRGTRWGNYSECCSARCECERSRRPGLLLYFAAPLSKPRGQQRCPREAGRQAVLPMRCHCPCAAAFAAACTPNPDARPPCFARC